MKKITFAVCGVGNRGTRYALMQERYPEDMEIVALADNRRERIDAVNKNLGLPEEALFDSADALFSVPKLADIVTITTQDAQHREHALKAMELGYDLLLEKPISNRIEEVTEIQKTAERLGRQVFICHVLRYTVFYKEIKRILDSGILGRVMTIEAAEHVGYYHQAHSYVRGNWHREEDSSCMILAKCCHDMDIFLWLTGKKCLRVSSFGSLDYFTRENAPEGSAERCLDCKVENCPYNAPRFYLEHIPGWPSNVLEPEPTPENILENLKHSDYGRCVWKMDNDVVDHQIVNLQLEDHVTVSFTMTGFNEIQTRKIRVMCTEGEIWGDFEANDLHWQRYHEERHDIDLNALTDDFDGHGGGDAGLMHDVVRYYRGDDFDSSSITTIARSAESHYVAFAAEASRLKDGELVRMDEFLNEQGE